MAKLIQLPGGGPVNDGERLVVAALVRELPDTYAVVPNIELVERGGQRLEYDVVVVAAHAVYVVETKAWLGDIVGDDRAWLVDGSTRAAPIQVTSHKAKVLKSRLADEMPLLAQAWVEPAVVLAFPPRSLVLTPEAQRSTFSLPELLKFIRNPGRLPHRPRQVDRLVDRAVGVLRGSAMPRGGPRAFHQWQVTEMLGSDGEETEYRAVHKLAPNLPPVRLRVVSLSPYMFAPAELELRRRLLTREFAALRAMGPHPNVATAHDVFEDDDGNLVIVSEEVDGLSLAMALTEGLDMSDAERLDLFRQLAKGVAHAHASGVIHRRVVPENVLLSPGGAVRLSGFGYARVEAAGTVYRPVDPDAVSSYLAPELSDPRHGAVGESSDLYGLGAIACALWAGEPPAPGSTAPEGLPAPLRAAVSNLLAVKPADRTTTLAELLRAMSAAERGTAETPSPTPAPGAADTLAPVQYPAGALIENRYEVKQVVGSGAFSTVYQVYDTVSLTDFALKVFGPNHGLETVQRELRALMQIRHPNVVEVVDAHRTTTTPTQWFLKSEYVAGTSLADFVSGDARLPVDQVVEIGIQLLDALCAFHPDATRIAELKSREELTVDEFDELQRLCDHGLVHRDIKPHNVLLRVDGRVKLVDFNIATPVGSPVVTMAGTPGYQPPDADLTAWDTSTDLFAVGVVLYQLLTGRHPYPTARPASGETPIPARDASPALPPALAKVVDRACAPLRSQRFDTAIEMRAALTALVADEKPEPLLAADNLADLPTAAGGTGPAAFWELLRDRLAALDHVFEPIPDAHDGQQIHLCEFPGGLTLGVKLFSRRIRVHLEAAHSTSSDYLDALTVALETLTGQPWLRESNWLAAYQRGRISEPQELTSLVVWAVQTIDALASGMMTLTAQAFDDRLHPEFDDAAITIDVGTLPAGHYLIGWLHTADYHYPLVGADSLVAGQWTSVLSDPTPDGGRKPAPDGAPLRLPGGFSLAFEDVIAGRWELTPGCCAGGPNAVVAEQISAGEWRFRHVHGADATIPDATLEIRVVERDGTARVSLHGGLPTRDEPDGSQGGEPLADAALARFIDDRARGAVERRWSRAFATGALARGDVTFEIGRSVRSPDGWTHYAMVRTTTRHPFGAVAYLSPATGRLQLRLPAEATQGRSHARLPKSNKLGSHAYQVIVKLQSHEAVEEALELLGMAIAAVLGAPDRSDSGRPSVYPPGPQPDDRADTANALQPVRAARDLQDLQRAFHLALMEGVRRCKAEVSYNPTAFVSMLATHGGVETARKLLQSTRTSDGFATLWERRRLDLTVEAIVLRPEFAELFSHDERETARRRLIDHGADVEELLRR